LVIDAARGRAAEAGVLELSGTCAEYEPGCCMALAGAPATTRVRQ
jgi:hypothetical protein